MKKILTMMMILTLSIILMACDLNGNITSDTQQTTDLNSTEEIIIPSYCDTTRVNGVYKCTKEFFAFDTVISTTFYINGQEDYQIENLYDMVESIILEYDKLFDPYEAFPDMNNIYTINNSQGPIVIDQKLYDAIEYALDNQDIDPNSEELLFNIAYEPVLELWHDARYSEDCQTGLFYDLCPLPSQEDLEADYNTNPDDILLNRDDQSIEFLKDNMGLDLGGFAKGYVSMIIQDALANYDANYILNLGASNVLVAGKNISNPSADTYAIGVTRPDFESLSTSYYGAAIIEDSFSVVSSGSYQRYFKNINDLDDETIYHHIIDPRTNQPGGQALALTIITTNTGQSDILSTAIFLMDFDYALDYVNSVEGLEAIWYFSEDDIRVSENFMDYFVYL